MKAEIFQTSLQKLTYMKARGCKVVTFLRLVFCSLFVCNSVNCKQDSNIEQFYFSKLSVRNITASCTQG